MTLFVIAVFVIILRRIISLVSIIIFNIIPGLFVMAFPGYYVGLTFGRGLSGGYKMRLAGRGIVDPVDAAISQRCFHNLSQLSSLSSQGVPLPMPPVGDGLPKWSPHISMGDCFMRCCRGPQCCIPCCCICFFVPPDINMSRDPAQIYDHIIFFGSSN